MEESRVIAAPDEFDVLRAKMMGDSNYDTSDPDIAVKMQNIESSGENYWNTMVKNADRTYLWNDLSNGAKSVSFATSYARLNTMATAYATVGSVWEGNAELRDDIVSAMDWLYDNWYNEHLSEGYETSTNSWYHWEVTAPKSLSLVVLKMYDAFTSEQIANYMNAVQKFVPDPTTRTMNGTDIEVGANRVWKAQIAAYHGIIVKSAEKLEMARDALSYVLAYVDSGDGFYTDGSFIQHNKHPYNGGYGKALLGEIARLVQLLDGSSWEVTDPNLNNIYQWVYEAFEPFIYKGAFMEMVRGREITRYASHDHAVGHSTMGAILQISKFAPAADALRMKSMLKYWIESDTSRNFYTSGATFENTVLAKQLMADPSIPSRGELIRNVQYHNMDRVVHLRPGFGLGVSMSSNRIFNYESISNVNMKSWYTADGMTYLYNNDLTQFSDNYWPTVDPYRLPGTTVDTLTRSVIGIGYNKEYLSPNAWTGGTSFEELYGTAGMDLKASGDLNASGSVVTPSSLVAKKSWFMFDDEIVALGAGITSTDNRTIETIVENRKINGDGDNALTVDGVQMSNALGWSDTMTNTGWAHLAGSVPGSDIGYVFPEGATVNGLREARTGKWGDLTVSSLPNPDNPVTRNYLSLWMDHGSNPSEADYAYVLLPNRDAASTGDYSDHPDIEILHNTALIQSVRENNLKLTGINFWEGGVFNETIWSYQPSSVMVKDDNGELSFSVSDPTHMSDKLIFEMNKSGLSVISQDPSVTVVRQQPTIKVEVNTAGAQGRSHAFKLAYDTTAPPPGFQGPGLESVQLTIDKPVLLIGESAALTVTALMEDGAPVDLNEAEILYGSNHPEVATVDATGLVTAHGGGSVQISATVTIGEDSITRTIDVAVPYGEPVVAQLDIMEDTYVRSGAYGDVNYGDATRLEAVKSGGDYNRRAYLKLDATSISEETYSAKLYLFGAISAAAGGITELELYSVADDSWSETELNWNNKPEPRERVASAEVNTTYMYREFDITEYMKSEARGDGIASLYIEGPSAFVTLTSSEHAEFRPYVVVNSYRFEPYRYDVALNANPTVAGTVYGAGSYDEGSTVTVTATPENGYSFARWTDDGNHDAEVSTDPSYTFMIDGSRQLTAHFVSDQPAQAGLTLTGNGTVLAGQAHVMTVSVMNMDTPFTTLDVVVNYDPQKLEFELVGEEGAESLAEAVIQSLRPNFSLLGSAAKPEQGEIRLILSSAGEQAAIQEEGPLFLLNSRVKASATQGGTTVSLSDMNASSNGIGMELDDSMAIFELTVIAANKAELQQAIEHANAVYDGATEGTEPGQYPVGSKAILAAAIQEAMTVLLQADAAQEAIDQAELDLNAATQAFAESVIPASSGDYSALHEAITAAENLYSKAQEGDKLGQYITGSKASLAAAIAAARGTAGSQAEIDQAVVDLQAAIDLFSHRIITLADGETRVSIKDLSILAMHYGITSEDEGWSEWHIADVLNIGVIDIRNLAAVAQMILDEWRLE
ncbi:polysaccharide lyase family 8 super-sandwich domain-containing protein [Paenibacillus chungangensis]|uniref:Polysaccharide lyase family 8 super-sandwich domain-containing protein n=1 Tax=Paenibacillus chungangensis TaxID=696535 RepID=A0ABW3HVZ6_9BACL